MANTKWTAVMDLNLIEAVGRAVSAGFHKTQGPKRTDNLRPYFWDAVAVMMADRCGGEFPHESPSAGACAMRLKDAHETKKNSDALTAAGEGALRADLEKFDDQWTAWDEAKLKAAEWERDIRESTYDRILEIQKTVDALAKEWGLKEAK